MIKEGVTDRRTALKARHRAAILAAARRLLDDRGGPQFTVDELAESADVARRTIFNHFASLDEVLLTVCSEELSVVVDEFSVTVARTPVGDGSRAAVFDELAQAIHASDLPQAIRSLSRILDVDELTDGRAEFLAGTAFSRVGDLLRDEIARRYRGADPLDVELLIGSLMNGLAVIATHWISRTGARLDETSRAEWDRLLSHLIDSIRSGYMPPR